MKNWKSRALNHLQLFYLDFLAEKCIRNLQEISPLKKNIFWKKYMNYNCNFVPNLYILFYSFKNCIFLWILTSNYNWVNLKTNKIFELKREWDYISRKKVICSVCSNLLFAIKITNDKRKRARVGVGGFGWEKILTFLIVMIRLETFLRPFCLLTLV